MEKITLSYLKKHIKKCNKKKIRYNFLGLVENRDLSPEVQSLFTFVTPSGFVGYDWVNGNDKMKELIKGVI
jgi:hypothetical protein